MNYFMKIFVIGVLFAYCTMAQDGELDLTFASSGIVNTIIGEGKSSGESIAIQPDGKIIIVGYTNNGDNNDIALVRYNVEGYLDNSFGINGKVITQVGSGDDFGRSLVIQSDSKIVITGTTINDQSEEDFLVARFNVDGSLDSSFGSIGIVTTDVVSDRNDFANSIAIQADGKIVVAGHTQSVSSQKFAVVRYNVDGSLDNSFGVNGIVTSLIRAGDFGRGLVIQADGKIIVCGSTEIFNGFYVFAVARFNTDGSLDNSFGTEGESLTFGTHCYNLKIQSDNKIVLVGKYWDGTTETWNIALSRLNYNGTIDQSFGNVGEISTNFGDMENIAYDVAIQTDGKIIAAGYARKSKSKFDYNKILLVRYNLNGSLDSTFGEGGKIYTTIDGINIESRSMAIQQDNKVIIAGYADYGQYSNQSDILVARYNIPTLTKVHKIDDKNSVDFRLHQNYPNPFNPTTTIKYSIPSAVMLNSFQHLNNEIPKQVRDDNAKVTLKVYDILGREVSTLVNEEKQPGNYEVIFDASNISNGVYFYTLKAGEYFETKKMVLIK